VTSQGDLLKRLTAALEGVGIAYMVAGSIGSSFHGHPRATNDLDIIIAPSQEQLDAFVALLGPDYYVSAASAKAAFNGKTMFNVVDNATGWKVDLVVRKERAFSIEEFQRRRKVRMMGSDIFIASPEDVILSKLEWAKNSGSEQQLRDALGVFKVQGDELDLEYLAKWARALNVEDSLEWLLETGRKNGKSGKGGEGWATRG